MKRFVLAIALVLGVLPAHAAGIAIRWGTCEGTSNRSFACDRTSGAELLVGSFSAPNGIRALSGLEVYMRITTADGTIPAWWQFIARGSCRQSSLSSRFDMSDETECDDPWLGQASGGLARYRIDGSAGVDLCMVAAVPQSAAHPLSGGQVYAAFKFAINHLRSNGPGACAGCSTPVCFEFQRAVLTQASDPGPNGGRSVPTVEITSGLHGAGNFATWQGGTPSCAAGAPKSSSWSQVKDKFRSH